MSFAVLVWSVQVTSRGQADKTSFGCDRQGRGINTSRFEALGSWITPAVRRRDPEPKARLRRRSHMKWHPPHADRARRRAGWSLVLRRSLPYALPAISAAVWPGSA